MSSELCQSGGNSKEHLAMRQLRGRHMDRVLAGIAQMGSVAMAMAARSMLEWDIRKPEPGTIAVGLAGGEPGVGGVRNHLRALKRYSVHSVRLLPGELGTRAVRHGDYVRQVRLHLEPRRMAGFAAVHSHVNPEFIEACAAGGRPWVHTYHSLYFEDAWGPLTHWQKRINEALIREARKADVLVSVSPWLQAFLREAHGIDTVCVPNGVDVALCDDAQPERFTRRFGLRDFVVFVGSLNEVKNPRLFIDLAREVPDLQFLMIGRGLEPETLGQWYGESLPTNLRALGPLSHAATLDAIAASRSLMMPSNFEGLPTALLEAMALGKPVVASDAYGCRDVVGDASCGVLVEPRSLADAKRGLAIAMESPDIGKNASRRVRELFDWKVVMPRIDSIYSNLIVTRQHA